MSIGETCVIQVTNIAPSATLEQMQTLFGCLGHIKEIALYPSDDSPIQHTSRICFVRYADTWSVGVAQHLTNTVFIDRALIITPVADGNIPDAATALAITNSSGFGGGSNNGVISQVIAGAGGSQVITTIDPRLTALGLPQYPPLPANMDPTKIEEIRRTVYIGNLDQSIAAEQLLKFFTEVGEIKFVRMAGDETQPARFAFVEFTDQSSVANALQCNGVLLGGRPIKINHANNAIVKPQTKNSEAAQKEIEEAMKRVREAQSLISAAIEPEVIKFDKILEIVKENKVKATIPVVKSRSRSRSRRRSESRSRKRSRSKERKRSRSRERRRSRSRSPRRRSRSPRRRSRSRSIERKHRRRSRSREREREKERERREREREREREKERERDRHRERKRRSRSHERSSRRKSRSRSRSRSKRDEREKSKEKHEIKSEKHVTEMENIPEGPQLPPEQQQDEHSNDEYNEVKEQVNSKSPLKYRDASPPSSSTRQSASSPRGQSKRSPRSKRSKSRSPRRRSPKSDRHKKKKERGDRSRSRERSKEKKKKRREKDESVERMIKRDYDEEEKGFDSDRDQVNKRSVTPE